MPLSSASWNKQFRPSAYDKMSLTAPRARPCSEPVRAFWSTYHDTQEPLSLQPCPQPVYPSSRRTGPPYSTSGPWHMPLPVRALSSVYGLTLTSGFCSHGTSPATQAEGATSSQDTNRHNPQTLPGTSQDFPYFSLAWKLHGDRLCLPHDIFINTGLSSRDDRLRKP